MMRCNGEDVSWIDKCCRDCKERRNDFACNISKGFIQSLKDEGCPLCKWHFDGVYFNIMGEDVE
jgi:hypothetical protein